MHTTVIAPSAAGFFGVGAGAAATGCGAGVGLETGVTGVGAAGVTGVGAGGATVGVTGVTAATTGAAGGVVATGGAVGAGSAPAVITGGAVSAPGGVVGAGVFDEPGCATTALNALWAEVKGPGPAAPAAAAAVEAPATPLVLGAEEPASFGDGEPFVDETIAITTPAMRRAIEHESAATTHIGGRRL